jgi:hypothetical protein
MIVAIEIGPNLHLENTSSKSGANRCSGKEREFPLFTDFFRTPFFILDMLTAIIGSCANAQIGSALFNEFADLGVAGPFQGCVVGAISAAGHDEQRDSLVESAVDDFLGCKNEVWGRAPLPRSAFVLIDCNHSGYSIHGRKIGTK